MRSQPRISDGFDDLHRHTSHKSSSSHTNGNGNGRAGARSISSLDSHESLVISDTKSIAAAAAAGPSTVTVSSSSSSLCMYTISYHTRYHDITNCSLY